jgi:hypothetical protein
MFEKQIVIDRIEVLADQTVAVRYVVTVTEDGKLFAEQVKGNYFKPGDDYSAEDAKVQTICAAVHTAEVVAAYQAALEAQRMTNVDSTAQV